jgi:tetratricopeptide (TPR) repeat protein
VSRPGKQGRRRWLILLVLSAVDASALRASAQDLLGAKEAIRKVRDQEENSLPAKESSDLIKTIQALPAKLEPLAPAAAAAAWLAVYDQWQALPKDVRAGRFQSQFVTLFDALPSPEAWPALADLIDARPVAGTDVARMRSLGLRMLGHRLTGRSELLKQDVEQALKLVEAPKQRGEKPGGLFAALAGAFRGPDEKEYWKQTLRAEIATVKQDYEPQSAVDLFRAELESGNPESGRSVEVPNLVRLLGREAATPLLLKALLLENVQLQFGSDRFGESENENENETVQLARELARDHLKELTHPIWELCHSIDAVELFEAFTAMAKPSGSNFDQEQLAASRWYIAGLMARDRPQDLIKFFGEAQGKGTDSRWANLAMTLGYSIVPRLERAGHSRKAQACLVEVLKSHPQLPLWDLFVELSARLGESPKVLTLLDQALAREALPSALRRDLRGVRADALLAADRIDDGVAQSLELLGGEGEGEADDPNPGRSRLDSAIRVAEIGRLLGRAEWLRQGTDVAEKILAGGTQGAYSGDLLGLLIDTGQLARAERLIIGALAKQAANEDENPGSQWSRFFVDGSTLADLLRVYHKANRPADVVMLLEEAPWWGQADVSEMLADDNGLQGGHGERTPLPTPLIAARSLVAVGRKDDARRIAVAMVHKWPGFDPGWRLALELTGDEFAPLAEQVFARDRFEERPLIWLAKFQLDRGDLEKAEQLARQAIAIDPSDGEQGRGDRMRVYSVLAEILAKRGDAQKAAIYEGAVKAIRLAEQADEYYAAGMLGRGVKMYRESLTYFADAYCIQSRLAVQLAESGDLEGASKHYQRAFELMPESFGRVESHCFGCEGVFKGPIAEKIAGRVFLKLIVAQPENPRVHYLLGYLRKSESRDADALKSYREAVRLDPDYLNAWLAILACDDAVLTPDVRDQAVFQVLRLDPSDRHSGAGAFKINLVRDLARLWTSARDYARLSKADATSSLFELKASEKALDEAKSRQRESDVTGVEFRVQSDGRVEFSSHVTLTAIATIIQSSEH